MCLFGVVVGFKANRKKMNATPHEARLYQKIRGRELFAHVEIVVPWQETKKIDDSGCSG